MCDISNSYSSPIRYFYCLPCYLYVKVKHRKLAMYIEHNELEKVETDLSSLNGYLKQEEYGDANAQIDVSIYVLEHIKNKTILNIIDKQNI